MAKPDEKKLIQQFNRGSKDALCQIYQRYKKDLYGFAISLLNDIHAAEDVVHDVFVSFAQKSGSYILTGTLKNYLLASVANRAARAVALLLAQSPTLQAAVVSVPSAGPSRW